MTTAVVATPAAVDLRLYGGDDFTMALTVTDSTGTAIDLTTSTVTATIRQLPMVPAPATSPPVLANFTCTVATNVVTLKLAHSDSANLPARCVWDCQRADATGNITSLAGGKVYVAPQVSP
jgi:hypothetical protein